MAREAYRSLYGDLTKLKDDSLLKDPALAAPASVGCSNDQPSQHLQESYGERKAQALRGPGQRP